MINQLLVDHLVPGSVARFIKSDWYDSGVLIVSREGEQSDEWQAFINTTQLLVDAVQPVADNEWSWNEIDCKPACINYLPP